MWIEGTTVGHLVDRAAERSPDAVAVVFPDTRTTYGELSRWTDAMAGCFAGLGIERGDKIGILMPNRLEFALAFIAAAKLGAVPVPINARFKAYELGHVISHADVRLLLTCAGPAGTADYPAILLDVFPDLAHQDDPWKLDLAAAPKLRQVVDIDALRAAEPPPSGAAFLTRQDLEVAGAEVGAGELEARQSRVRIRDIAMLMYTSGTSARPKGCLLTHEALVRHAGNVARDRFLLTAEDRFWDPLPLFHIGGIVPMLGCFSVGATLLSTPATSTPGSRYAARGRALHGRSIRRSRRSGSRCSTTRASTRRRPQRRAADPEHRACRSGWPNSQARMPWAAQVSSYGATESSSNLTLTRPDDPYEVRIDTLGRAAAGDGDQRSSTPRRAVTRDPGEVGELCCRGYSLFEGYYKDPELDGQTLRCRRLVPLRRPRRSSTTMASSSTWAA